MAWGPLAPAHLRTAAVRRDRRRPSEPVPHAWLRLGGLPRVAPSALPPGDPPPGDPPPGDPPEGDQILAYKSGRTHLRIDLSLGRNRIHPGVGSPHELAYALRRDHRTRISSLPRLPPRGGALRRSFSTDLGVDLFLQQVHNLLKQAQHFSPILAVVCLPSPLIHYPFASPRSSTARARNSIANSRSAILTPSSAIKILRSAVSTGISLPRCRIAAAPSHTSARLVSRARATISINLCSRSVMCAMAGLDGLTYLRTIPLALSTARSLGIVMVQPIHFRSMAFPPRYNTRYRQSDRWRGCRCPHFPRRRYRAQFPLPWPSRYTLHTRLAAFRNESKRVH